jgi:hypothetical protein
MPRPPAVRPYRDQAVRDLPLAPPGRRPHHVPLRTACACASIVPGIRSCLSSRIRSRGLSADRSPPTRGRDTTRSEVTLCDRFQRMSRRYGSPAAGARSTTRATTRHTRNRVFAGGAGGTRTHGRRVMRSTAPRTHARQQHWMTRDIALTAVAGRGLSSGPRHEPFHARGSYGSASRYCAQPWSRQPHKQHFVDQMSAIP